MTVLSYMGGPSQSLNYVWNVNTLAWDPMEQPVIEGSTITVGTVDQGTGGVSPWLVSGTVTANLGTLNGAATSAKQDTGNTSLASIDAKLTNPLPVSGTVTIDPTGLATSARQDTGNASLASIAAEDFATQTTLAAILAKILAAPATEAKQDTGNTSLASIDAKLTNPLPVSGSVTTGGLTDAQLRAAPVPVSGTVTVDTSLLATAAKQDAAATLTGAVTEAAPATDTASSGLNGRLQRIAQRMTSLITALGSPFQAGGSIGNTTFAATQATATNLKAQAENYQGGTAVGAANPLHVSLANTGSNSTPVIANPYSYTSGSIVGVGQSLTLSVVGASYFSIAALTDGDPTDAIAIEGSLNGSTWIAIQTIGWPTPGVAAGGYSTLTSGFRHIRVTGDTIVTGGTLYLQAIGLGSITESTLGSIYGQVLTTRVNTDPLLLAAAGGYIRQDSNATIAKETGGNLATIATNTTDLNTAQGADAEDVTGPLVQAVVSDTPQSYVSATIQPLSVTSEGRLRVSTVESYNDRIWQHTFESPWASPLQTVADADLSYAGEITYV